MIKYSDIPEMKKNFEIRKKQENSRCQVCKRKPTLKRELHVHHINGKKWDHSLKNLLVACVECHHKMHKKIGPWSYRKIDTIKTRIAEYQAEIKRLEKILKKLKNDPLDVNGRSKADRASKGQKNAIKGQN